jgi:sortase family protein
MSPTRRRRPALLTALALLLAVEAVTTVAVRAAEITDARTLLAAATSIPAAPFAAPPVVPVAAIRPPVHDARLATDALAPAAVVVEVRVAPVRRAMPAPVARAEVVRPQATSTTKPASTTAAAPRGQMLGRNHVWSPALGIDKRVYSFPCSRSQKPGNVVYRWGCAGRNNVYLMGHAANVFGSLNRSYYNGRLRRGLKVYYADSGGTVRTYAVRWWKVVEPTPDAAWAWASLSAPSMTLQTCIGRNSEYRLMVRLAQVG